MSRPEHDSDNLVKEDGCRGCRQLREEVAWLRAQVEKLQDRAVSLPLPVPLPAPVAAPTPPVDVSPEIVWVDDAQFVAYQGRLLRKTDWDRMLAGQGFIDPSTGTFVSNDEFARANAMLDAQVGAGRN